jgi:hypothetical protein
VIRKKRVNGEDEMETKNKELLKEIDEIGEWLDKYGTEFRPNEQLSFRIRLYELMSELKGRKDKEEEIKELINPEKIYPTDIFPEMEYSDLVEISRYIDVVFGYPLDRLSAHISRKLLIGIKDEAENI